MMVTVYQEDKLVEDRDDEERIEGWNGVWRGISSRKKGKEKVKVPVMAKKL